MPSGERVSGNTPERPASGASEGVAPQVAEKPLQETSPESEKTPSEDRAPERPVSRTSETEAGRTGEKPAQETSPKSQGRLPPSRIWAIAFAALAGLFLAMLVVVVYDRFSSTAARQSAEGTLSERVPTESLFQDSVREAKSTGDGIDEWRAARSDHKIIAYAIARCLKIDVATMSPDTFSMLLLDLRPNGDHLWSADAGKSSQPTSADQQINQINGYQGAMLALSDAVSRARVAAASGAGGFYPQMWWFGWISVFVSALATMVVTLRATMTTTGWGPRLAGILAILFSTAATVLTGAKQFWDPTNAYMRNETALLALKQLHQDIALNFVASWDASTCKPQGGNEPEQDTRFARWRNTLVSLQIGTMAAPVIVQNQIAQPGNTNLEQIPRNNPPRDEQTKPVGDERSTQK
jgi:hypothetical protein